MNRSLSRRAFLAAAAAASTAAPAVFADDKSGSKKVIVGEGEHRFEVQHGWPQLPAKYSWQTTHNVAVDKAGNLAGLDVELLEQRFVRFVKVDAATLIAETRDAQAAEALRSIKRRLDESAIDLIVDRIESEAELVELLDLPVDFGQGLLFGEPRTS